MTLDLFRRILQWRFDPHRPCRQAVADLARVIAEERDDRRTVTRPEWLPTATPDARRLDRGARP